MNPIDRLTVLFERFPGIGPRQARRFVQYLLATQPSVRAELAQNIKELGASTLQCKRCFRWFIKSGAKDALCATCISASRDKSLLFVIEKDADMENVERSGFKGLYFILGGTIPLASQEYDKHIRLRQLLARIEEEASTMTLSEVILGLSATTEGDHTRLLLQEKIRPIAERLNVKVTSLGRGLSTGSELEYADPDTIASALHSRQ